MRRLLFSFLFISMLHFAAPAQESNDSIPPPVSDTIRVTRVDTAGAPPPTIRRWSDSVSRRPPREKSWRLENDSSSTTRIIAEIFAHHPWVGFGSQPERVHAIPRVVAGKELMFYVMIGLLLLFAILRSAFAKYFNDLFRVFFRTTIKQRQIREQLMQTPLPSLLMNGFFVITAGFYLGMILEYYNKNPFENYWLLTLYCCLGIAIAYFIKFLGLKMIGVILGMQAAANAYIFIVFVVNKMVGILLLPVVVLLAFTAGGLRETTVHMSFILLVIMLIYRLVLTFAAVRNQIKVNPFHFLLYILAFEIAPLLLVYRALLLYFPGMA